MHALTTAGDSENLFLFAAFQAHRLKYRAAGVLRDGLALFIGQRRAMETLMSAVGFEKKWGPISLSQETIRSYETPPSLQAVIAMCLLDMGYEAKGPWRRKRFYRLHQNTD